VIQHIVLLKLKPGVTDEQIEEAFEAGSELPNEIPGLLRLLTSRDHVPIAEWRARESAERSSQASAGSSNCSRWSLGTRSRYCSGCLAM
jgi:hypothetical protein